MTISKIGEPFAVTDWTDWLWAGHARTVGAAPADFVQIGATGIFAWEFGNNEELYFPDCQLSHAYKEGQAIIPHIHWFPSTTETYTGTWTLTYVEWLSTVAGTAMSGVNTTTVSFDSAMTANQMQNGEFSPTMTGTGRKISSLACMKLVLTLSAGTSVFLLGLDGHYEMDRLGSTSKLLK